MSETCVKSADAIALVFSAFKIENWVSGIDESYERTALFLLRIIKEGVTPCLVKRLSTKCNM